MSMHVDNSKNAARIRELNDQLRKTFVGGHVCITKGVSNRCDVKAILAAVQSFDSFNESNDPFHEHDFGAIDVSDLILAGKHPPIQEGSEMEAPTVFFKLDYYGLGMQSGSPDAADPNLTERVITIYLSEEH